MTKEEILAEMRPYLPGVLPSGWSRLTNRVVHRFDGVAVAAYSGFGMTVIVESRAHEAGRRYLVRVSCADGISLQDLLRVVNDLYRRSPYRDELYVETKQYKIGADKPREIVLWLDPRRQNH